MKIIKILAPGALAALAAALLFQTSSTQAHDQGQRDGDHRDAKATFTKWVTDFPNLPGEIANMAGVVGGDVGPGVYTGEVLLYKPGPTPTSISHFVAFYRFTGQNHSFTALVNVLQTGSGPGTKAVITGVVTDGWLEGHAVKGEYTEGTCGTPSIPCFTGTLEIDRHPRN